MTSLPDRMSLERRLVTDRAFDRLAYAEGYLSTVIRSLEQLGAERLAQEIYAARDQVRDVSKALVRFEAQQ